MDLSTRPIFSCNITKTDGRLGWEEPHPGRRLSSLPELNPSGWDDKCARVEGRWPPCGGEHRSGMAAKARSEQDYCRYRIQRLSFTKRPIRPIRFQSYTKVRRCSAEDGAQEVHRTRLCPGRPVAQPQDSMMIDALSRLSAELESDMESRTDVSMETYSPTLCADDMLAPISSLSLPISFAELSHFFENLPMEGGSYPMACFESYDKANMGLEDVYGWEAELDKQLLVQNRRRYLAALRAVTSTMKRGNVGARKLFQRVLNFGRDPAADANFSRRTSMVKTCHRP